MSAEIIILPVVRVERCMEGNRAREAFVDIANTLPGTIDRPGDAERWSDWLLAELWARGFKVVPTEVNDEHH